MTGTRILRRTVKASATSASRADRRQECTEIAGDAKAAEAVKALARRRRRCTRSAAHYVTTLDLREKFHSKKSDGGVWNYGRPITGHLFLIWHLIKISGHLI